MRRFFLFLLAFFSISFCFSFSSDDIDVFTLENGLECFVLPDHSSATIRMELVVKSGFSFQNEKNAGFFPFYAHLIDGEINADTVKILKKSSPNEFEKNLGELKKILLPLTATNQELEREFNAMKETVSEYSLSVSGFINTAIDSRVFEKEPWRTESGVYPSLFSKNSVENVRSILDEIQKNYYTPDNSLLFVSGNISKKSAREKISSVFETLNRGNKIIFEKKAERKLGKESGSESAGGKENSESKERKIEKYVLVDDEFSPEMSQIVVQFSDFDKRECDLLSKILGEDNSLLKKEILSTENTGISDEYYINFSSSLTLNSSRLIIQALLEKNKSSVVKQSENFIGSLFDSNKILSLSAEKRIKKVYEKEFLRIKDESSSLMALLSSWCVLNESNDVQKFLDNNGNFTDFSAEEVVALEEKFKNSNAKVFLLVASEIYNKNKKDFSKNAWNVVTRKNGSWYTSVLHEKKIKEESEKKLEQLKAKNFDSERNYKNFIDNAKKSFQSFKLSNGIPVTVKKDELKETASFTIMINGGEFEFANEQPFLWGIITDCFVWNIRKELDLREKSGVFKGSFSIDSENHNFYSTVTVSCLADDLTAVLEACGIALIYGEITPVLADGFIYNTRSNYRIKSGSLDNQLLCHAVWNFYPESDLKELYCSNKKEDVLEKVRFNEIDAAYTAFLNAGRFELIFCGGIFDTRAIISNLNRNFGILENIDSVKKGSGFIAPNSSEKGSKIVKSVQLKHQFFTDVSAEKAGPRPLVLIPTKKFYDPVMYIFQEPPVNEKKEKALFQALLLEVQNRLQKETGTTSPVRISFGGNDLPFATLCVFQIERYSLVDKALNRVLSKLTEELENISSKDSLVEQDGEISYSGKNQLILELENLWMTNFLSDTGTNSGTANLVSSSLFQGNSQNYLDFYETVCEAEGEDYLKVLKKYFDEDVISKFYSKDTKK